MVELEKLSALISIIVYCSKRIVAIGIFLYMLQLILRSMLLKMNMLTCRNHAFLAVMMRDVRAKLIRRGLLAKLFVDSVFKVDESSYCIASLNDITNLFLPRAVFGENRFLLYLIFYLVRF